MTWQFLDRDAAERARSSLHSVYWEMLLAAGLLEAGAELVPRSKRTPRNSGPDLLSESPKAWVEAIAVEAGTGIDAVPPPQELTAYSVPDDQILLRITQAIEAKRLKRDDYLRRKWLKETDAYVIAVNSGNIPNGKSELPLPRIVRAVFPFGHQAVTLKVETGDVMNVFYHHRDSITKKTGTTVNTALFEDEASCGISALLYSVADAFNPPKSYAESLILVHNPFATTPIPRGIHRGLLEYWRDGKELRWERAATQPSGESSPNTR